MRDLPGRLLTRPEEAALAVRFPTAARPCPALPSRSAPGLIFSEKSAPLGTVQTHPTAPQRGRPPMTCPPGS